VTVTTLLEIEKAIENLPPPEFQELRRWVSERDSKQWDKEIADDLNAGKFDELRQRIRADYDVGRCCGGRKALLSAVA